MKRFLTLVLAVAVPVLSGFGQETPPVVTLQQCIDSALASSDSYKILQGTLAVSKAQYAESVSKNSLGLQASAGAGYNVLAYNNGSYLSGKSSSLSSSTSSPQGAAVGLGLASPMTSITVSASPFSPPAGNSPSSSGSTDLTSSAGLSVSQTLWNGYPGGTAKAAVDKSLLSLQGQELSTESGKLGLIYQVKQAYFALFTAQQDLDSKKQILDRQNALLDQITAVYNLKQASAVDLKTAQINAHSAEIDVRTSEHTLRLARIRLANLVGIAPDRVFAAAQPADESLPAASLEAAVSIALQQRVDLKLIELSRKSNAVDLAVARGLSTPTVSVMGGVDLYMDNTTSNFAGLANAGVKIAMPILDAGAARNLVDQGTRLDEVYQSQGAQLRKSIAADVQDAWESMELAREKADLAGQAAENDDLIVEVYKIQSRNGTASTQDLLTASVNAATAHTAAVQAQAAAQLAILQLLNVMGY